MVVDDDHSGDLEVWVGPAEHARQVRDLVDRTEQSGVQLRVLREIELPVDDGADDVAPSRALHSRPRIESRLLGLGEVDVRPAHRKTIHRDIHHGPASRCPLSAGGVHCSGVRWRRGWRAGSSSSGRDEHHGYIGTASSFKAVDLGAAGRRVVTERGGLRTCDSSLLGRYYDPQTGQFLSVDPLVDETGEPYEYVGGDPVDRTDPNGEAGTQFAGGGACTTQECPEIEQDWNMSSGQILDDVGGAVTNTVLAPLHAYEAEYSCGEQTGEPFSLNCLKYGAEGALGLVSEASTVVAPFVDVGGGGCLFLNARDSWGLRDDLGP
jgi:hypothetical protein